MLSASSCVVLRAEILHQESLGGEHRGNRREDSVDRGLGGDESHLSWDEFTYCVTLLNVTRSLPCLDHFASLLEERATPPLPPTYTQTHFSSLVLLACSWLQFTIFKSVRVHLYVCMCVSARAYGHACVCSHARVFCNATVTQVSPRLL